MKKKTFLIIIPMTYTLEVEAENEDEALDIYTAMDTLKLDKECDVSDYPDTESVIVECYEK